MWSQILISISCFVSILIVLNRVPKQNLDIKISAITALLFLLITEILLFYTFPYAEIVTEAITLLAFTIVLSMLLMIIHMVKPEFVRYPYPIVFMPLIIVLGYPLIKGINALTDLILILLQGGGIIVFFLLFTAHHDRFKRKWLLLFGGFLLFGTYVIYWFLEPYMGEYHHWVWQSLAAIGMIITALEFPDILKNYSKK